MYQRLVFDGPPVRLAACSQAVVGPGKNAEKKLKQLWHRPGPLGLHASLPAFFPGITSGTRVTNSLRSPPKHRAGTARMPTIAVLFSV